MTFRKVWRPRELPSQPPARQEVERAPGGMYRKGEQPSMHSVQVRYDVHRARAAGLSGARIFELTGVCARSQQRIAHEEILFGMNDREFHAKRRLGRPTSLTEAVQRPIQQMLGEHPTMK